MLAAATNHADLRSSVTEHERLRADLAFVIATTKRILARAEESAAVRAAQYELEIMLDDCEGLFDKFELLHEEDVPTARQMLDRMLRLVRSLPGSLTGNM